MASIPSKSIARPFRASVEWDGSGQAQLRLTGELDLAAEAEFEGLLREVTWESPREIVLDLRGLTFIDSTGIRMLLGLSKQSLHDGYQLTCIPSPDRRVQRALDVTGIGRALRMSDGDMS